MIAEKTTEHIDDIKSHLERYSNLDSRWGEERRKKQSDGFTYISSVGWIDRREKLRRKDDPGHF